MPSNVDTAELTTRLLNACQQTSLLDWSCSSEQYWSLALAKLVETATLFEIQQCAHLVNQQFPLDRYAMFVTALSNQASALQPFSHFKERAGRDYLPFVAPDSDVAILVFCGSAHRVGFPLKFAHRWFGSFNATVIYLFDESKTFYFNGLVSVPGCFLDTIDFLKQQLTVMGINHVYCYGASLGCYAAIRAGIALGAEGVLNFAGPTNLTAEFLLEHNMYVKWLPLVLTDAENAQDMRLALLQCAKPPQVTLFYGEDNLADSTQAANLAGLPSVRLVAVAGVSEHNVVREVILNNSWYSALFAWLNIK